jgi:hypothetical protein
VKHRLSGSKYGLALKCAYWARADVVCPPRPVGDAAKIGTAVHSLVEAHQRTRMGWTDVPEPMSDWDIQAYPMARQANDYLERQVVDVPTAVEIPIIYDAANDTARLAEMDGPRGYRNVGPMEIPTTLDLLWRTKDGIDVVDLKSGSAQHASPEQLDIQALAASRLYGAESARVGFLFARKTKVIPPEWRELDADALAGEAWQASSLLRRLPVAQPEPGSHCYTCPLGRDRCPAHAAPTAEDMAEASSFGLTGE